MTDSLYPLGFPRRHQTGLRPEPQLLNHLVSSSVVPPMLDSRSVEALVEKVRRRLDYPEDGELQGYCEAVEALDRLANLAHDGRKAPLYAAALDAIAAKSFTERLSMIEDVIAKIEGALEEASIEVRIFQDLRDQSDGHAQAHDAIVRSRNNLVAALREANRAKGGISGNRSVKASEEWLTLMRKPG